MVEKEVTVVGTTSLVCKARREYRCDCCGRSIPENSLYRKVDIREAFVNGKRYKFFENVHLNCTNNLHRKELPANFNKDWRQRAKQVELHRDYYHGKTE
jgi:hypothetical protein